MEIDEVGTEIAALAGDFAKALNVGSGLLVKMSDRAGRFEGAYSDRPGCECHGPLGRRLLARIEASGVNPLDTKIRAGLADHARTKSPAILGIDLAGTVVTVADDIAPFRPDGRVYGMTGWDRRGAWLAR